MPPAKRGEEAAGGTAESVHEDRGRPGVPSSKKEVEPAGQSSPSLQHSSEGKPSSSGSVRERKDRLGGSSGENEDEAAPSPLPLKHAPDGKPSTAAIEDSAKKNSCFQ